MCRSNQIPRRCRVKEIDNNSDTTSTTTKRRAHAWLTRSTAQRTVVSVTAQVDHFISKCNFLSKRSEYLSSSTSSDIAPIYNNDISVGIFALNSFFDEFKLIKFCKKNERI